MQHLRKKSKALSLFTPTNKASGLSLSSTTEEGYELDKKEAMSFATPGEMAGRTKHPYVGMVSDSNMPMGPSPGYKVDRDDTLNPSPWDVRQWSWKKWAMLIAGIVIVVVVIVVAVVEVEKNNKYPDYSPLTYTLADTCKNVPSPYSRMSARAVD